MRLVSQHGNVDLPYENTVLLHNMDYVVAQYDGKEYVMGKYSFEEKAHKVMEMLREAYLSRMELDGGYDVASGCYVQPNYWVLPKVFQFPKDKEIEVENQQAVGKE